MRPVGTGQGADSKQPIARQEAWLVPTLRERESRRGGTRHGESCLAGMNVLFFDAHTEFRPRTELDPATAVGATAPPGQPKPLLWRLRN